MTKKTVGYVKMLWSCPRCATRNPGPQKFCNGCGAPQPADVPFEQTPEEKLLTDAAEIASAKAGPDVHCPYCNGRNSGKAKYCGACGGDLAGVKARDAGKVAGAFRSAPAAPVTCSRCGTSNPASSLQCSNCGASLTAGVAPIVAASTASPARPAKRPPVVLILILAGLCGLGALAALLFATRKTEVVGVVDSVAWERSVSIEALSAVDREAWRDEIPAGADLGSCREAHRYTSQDPVSNSIEVCGTPYTLDTGSGFGEVVQDCVYEVYDELCSYTAEEWAVIDKLVSNGSAGLPAWPSVSLDANERQGEQSESYSVVFETADGRYTYTLASASEFSAFAIGSHWNLEVSGFGSITNLQPAP
jgi:hypothetical protein